MDNQPDALHRFRLVADRIMLATIAAVFVICLGIAAFTGTWTAALVIGVPTVAVAFLLYNMARGQLVFRLTVAVAFMVFAALSIHQTSGAIEAHFGVFVLMSFLVLYCDWRPPVVAGALIAVHHLAFNYLQGGGAGVYVFPEASGLGRVIGHAVYVVAQVGFLIYVGNLIGKLVRHSMLASELAERIGAGDFSYRLPESETRDSPVLNAMAEMQGKLIATLTQVRRDAETIANAALQLSRTSEQIASGTGEQTTSTSAVAASVEELTASIHVTSDNSRSAQDLALDSGRLSESGRDVVKSAAAEIQEIAEVVAQTASSVETMGRKSESAAKVVVIIKGIAEQTNLLALNAAIEAARAGESGRGFAVVSDEVRKLAESTRAATSEIEQMIRDMQDSKNDMLASIEKAVGRAQSGVARALEAEASIDAVAGKAKQVGDLVSEIADTLQEQSSATQNIAQHVERITTMADSSSAATFAIAGEIDNLTKVAASLSDVVNRFRLAER